MTEKLSLDDFLEKQTSASLTNLKATVEAIKDEPDHVKITPWFSTMGCLCSMAIKVSKSAIASVSLTDDTHSCCGKVLRVVEVEFKEGEKISLDDLFTQLAMTAQSKSHSHEVPPRVPEARMSYNQSYLGYGPNPHFLHYPDHQLLGQYGGPHLTTIPPRPRDPYCTGSCADGYDSCISYCTQSDVSAYLTCICICRNAYCYCQNRCNPGRGCFPVRCQ